MADCFVTAEVHATHGESPEFAPGGVIATVGADLYLAARETDGACQVLTLDCSAVGLRANCHESRRDVFYVYLDSTRAIFGRSYAAEPDVLIEQLRKAEADTLLLTIPNQLGVAYNVHVLESLLTHVAPGIGWR